MDERDQLIEELKCFFMEDANQANGIELVFLYGSWARGIPRDDSDIDLAIIFSEEIRSDQTAFEHMTDISYRLTERLKKEVNVLKIYNDFRKPMLYYNAIVLGISVFIKNKDRFLSVVNEAIYQMEDFSILRREIWRTSGMPEFRYAKGRIEESIQFISEEMKEFEEEYANQIWVEYQKDKKLQKIMDRTVENILTAFIEVCGTLLTEEGLGVVSYTDAIRKTSNRFGLSEKEAERLGKLAIQRNRLAHRYLNFRWEAIQMFNGQKSLLIKLLSRILETIKEKHNVP